jgi:formylglycine-generating enzyme required for sulfatase activity
MAGNVAEWTATAHLASFRFIRGGSFVSSSADDLKVAARQWRNPEQGDNWLGFRCATSPP